MANLLLLHKIPTIRYGSMQEPFQDPALSLLELPYLVRESVSGIAILLGILDLPVSKKELIEVCVMMLKRRSGPLITTTNYLRIKQSLSPINSFIKCLNFMPFQCSRSKRVHPKYRLLGYLSEILGEDCYSSCLLT